MRRSQLIIFPALIVSSLLAASCSRHPSSGTPADFAELKRSIRERFPEVRQISTEELSNWFAMSPRGGCDPACAAAMPATNKITLPPPRLRRMSLSIDKFSGRNRPVAAATRARAASRASKVAATRIS